MDIKSIIRKKRAKEELTKDEINYFIGKLQKGEISEPQAAAVMSYIYTNGLTEEEEKIQYYNDALLRNGYCKDFGKSCHLIETTLLDADCFALEAAESIMPDMRKKYIKSFNNRYKCNSCK